MVNKKHIKRGLTELKDVNVRVRLPRDDEFIGIVEKRLGGSRMHIRKNDGSITLGSVPGRMKKFLWIREGDVVLLKPWQIEKTKADLIYKYKNNEIKKLRAKKLVGSFEVVEEF